MSILCNGSQVKRAAGKHGWYSGREGMINNNGTLCHGTLKGILSTLIKKYYYVSSPVCVKLNGRELVFSTRSKHKRLLRHDIRCQPRSCKLYRARRGKGRGRRAISGSICPGVAAQNDVPEEILISQALKLPRFPEADQSGSRCGTQFSVCDWHSFEMLP